MAQKLVVLLRTARALDNPNIILQVCNGSMSLHIFDLELSTEDLETILQHVGKVTEFTYIDRHLSTVVRNTLATFWKSCYSNAFQIRCCG